MDLAARDELWDSRRQEAPCSSRAIVVVTVGMAGDPRSPSPAEIKMATDELSPRGTATVSFDGVEGYGSQCWGLVGAVALVGAAILESTHWFIHTRESPRTWLCEGRH